MKDFLKSVWLSLLTILKSEGSLQCLQKLAIEPAGSYERMF